MIHLNYLLSSKTEADKRKLIDLIDSLHEEEQEDMDKDFKDIRADMRKWQRKMHEPYNIDVFVVDKQLKAEAEAVK